jgi:Xaa-Pro aminopeptidase
MIGALIGIGGSLLAGAIQQAGMSAVEIQKALDTLAQAKQNSEISKMQNAAESSARSMSRMDDIIRVSY